MTNLAEVLYIYNECTPDVEHDWSEFWEVYAKVPQQEELQGELIRTVNKYTEDEKAEIRSRWGK